MGCCHRGPDGDECVDHRGEVAERWTIWRDEKTSRFPTMKGKGQFGRGFRLDESATSDAVIAVDVGNNTYSFGRYFEVENQSVLMWGYLGSIGLGFRRRWVRGPRSEKNAGLGVSGDGGFGEYTMEMPTAVKYGMNITHVIMNNGELGKISKEQRAGEFEVWKTRVHNPDFGEYADFAARRVPVESQRSVDAALGLR